MFVWLSMLLGVSIASDLLAYCHCHRYRDLGIFYSFTYSISGISTAGIHGLTMAAYVCTLSLAALELFDIKEVNFVTGILQFFTGLGAFSAPPLVSYIYEMLGKNMISAMATIGGIYALGTVLSCLCWILHKKICANH